MRYRVSIAVKRRMLRGGRAGCLLRAIAVVSAFGVLGASRHLAAQAPPAEPTPLESTPAAAPSSRDERFEREIAPILEMRCVGCHRGIAARGKLRLTTREELLAGGESGAAIVPGDAAASLLVEMISGDAPSMPAEGPPLSPTEMATISDWIVRGAVWSEGHVLLPRGENSAWWSLAPIERTEIPRARDANAEVPQSHPVDAFVDARLIAEGIEPASEAPRAALIRRLTFDLHGLPPTPEEVHAFVADPATDAYERLVDRLLASPRYGQRWARHWLDLVHFGETHGYDKDKRRDHAWRYRDWVIAAFNADKPFERFVREQIAGDYLWPDDRQAVIATGFLAAGPWDFVGHAELAEGTVEKEKTRLLDRDDMLTTVMSTFASTTAHCARCHDHPFDPISQRDYYAVQAALAGVDRGDRPLPPSADGSGEGSTPAAEELTYAVRSVPPRSIHLLGRGEVTAPREEIAAGALAMVEAVDVPFPAGDAPEGARRAALADWLVSAENPLTWRSIVNRVWQFHFGRGLVDTPNDFGRQGSKPSHPQLLDWLAAEFREHGSFKQLHRLLVTSRAYRRSSAASSDSFARDPENRWLSRAGRRRLEGEEIRDAVLAASGKLDDRLEGPSFELYRFEDDHSPRYLYTAFDEPRVWRRTVYRLTVRSVQEPFLETLDCPDPSLWTPRRSETITPLAALALWNNPFMLRQAEHLAARVSAEAESVAEQVQRLAWLAWSREADAEESKLLVEFAQTHGLAAACRLVLNSSEFVFVD